MKIFNHTQSGFSLVETLVAISLLLIIIVGPMTISSKAAKSSTFASEQVQAFFLAQEGLELAVKARDDLQLAYFQDPVTNFKPWGQFTDKSNSGLYRSCFIDVNPDGCGLMWAVTAGKLATVTACAGNAKSCLLFKNNDTNFRAFYTYWDNSGANPETLFVRRIYFSTTDITREVHIRSVVTWRTGSLIAEQKVEVDTYLFNTYANQ